MAEVVLSNVNKTYGRVHAVKDVNLTVNDEEFVVLVGPSGCGKSTTLRMVAGLEEITGGTISIGGRVVNDLPPKDRDLAMVFQNYALYQHMTVYDNLAFGLRNRKVPEETIGKEVDRAAGILGITDLLKRKPRQLSGGQQQRVALGRCIVRHPQVKHLRERVPTTSIYVTHDQVEAMTLGDRVVVMRDGWVQQVGTPLEIYNEPRNLFVAGFMGSPPTNFIDVTVAEADGKLYAEAKDFRVRIPQNRDAALRPYAGRPVTLGIRPEHIVLGEQAPELEAGFDGDIDVTEQLGSELLVGITAAGTAIMVSRIDPQRGLTLHESVRLSLNPAHLHFFDQESEEAIA
jgi:multiple sugar transport system ATP-binding protein